MNATENNKLIVQFMKLEPIKVNTDFYALEKNHVHITGKNPEIVISGFSEFAKYHTDWNWLMEVVEKIESLEDNRFLFQMSTRQGFYAEVRERFSYETKIEDAWGKTRIEAAYNACVEFIKWHNEQN